jgi:hypothetical protein
MKACGFVRYIEWHIVYTTGSQMAVRLLALRAGRILCPQKYLLVLFCVGG